MKQCQICGATISETARFCSKCGSPVTRVNDIKQCQHLATEKQVEQKQDKQPEPQEIQQNEFLEAHTQIVSNIGVEAQNNQQKEQQETQEPQYQQSKYYQPQYQQQYGSQQSNSQQSRTTARSSSSRTIVDSLNQYVGGEAGHVDLNWMDLFRNVFKGHSTDEAEEVFICGTKYTTPTTKELTATWPKPWLYSRIFLGFAIAFIILRVCCEVFENINALPGVIILGTFAVPFSLIVMFIELNVFKNVSFYYVMKIFLIGGCASLLLTLLLYEFIVPEDFDMTYPVAFGVSIAEELGKVIIVFLFLRKLTKTHSILVGMVVGSAVGAGFAAFESSGYAFQSLASMDWDFFLKIIYLRGVLAPGGHVAWGAIGGAALVMANTENPITTSVFGQTKFWRLFIIPIICHFLWDAPIEWGQDYYLVQLILCVFIWIIVLILVNLGLNEVEKAVEDADLLTEE